MNLELKHLIVEKKKLREKLLKDGLIKKDDVVYLSGSIVESVVRGDIYSSIGNKLSDIDIYIITSSNFDNIKGDGYKKIHKHVEFKRYDGIQYDIEIYKYEDVEKMLIDINNIEFSEQIRIPNLFNRPRGWSSRDVRSFINRFNYSIVLQNEKKYKKLKKIMNVKNFNKYEIQILINEIEGLVRDVIGNLKKETYDTVLYLCREVFVKFLFIILNLNGETVDREKWAIYKGLIILEENNKNIFNMYNLLFKDNLVDFKKGEYIITECLNEINDYLVDIDIMEI